MLRVELLVCVLAGDLESRLLNLKKQRTIGYGDFLLAIFFCLRRPFIRVRSDCGESTGRQVRAVHEERTWAIRLA